MRKTTVYIKWEKLQGITVYVVLGGAETLNIKGHTYINLWLTKETMGTQDVGRKG